MDNGEKKHFFSRISKNMNRSNVFVVFRNQFGNLSALSMTAPICVGRKFILPAVSVSTVQCNYTAFSTCRYLLRQKYYEVTETKYFKEPKLNNNLEVDQAETNRKANFLPMAIADLRGFPKI